jgi:Na+/H+ antiporter NhaD/arsenite permease-like protein
MVETEPILLVPFILLLGAMACGPVLAPKWWARYYAVVALGLGAITIGFYGFGLNSLGAIEHAAREYFSFIALVGSLFVVSGGIQLQVRSSATPLANVMFLLAGAVAANILGTTGAAILLIRPWLRINQQRAAPHQAAFFIFLVANVGGGLTPIGDPPLFLGYLEGVPFWWVLQHGWLAWATAVGLLLGIFYVIDQQHFKRHATVPEVERLAGQTWQFRGGLNLFFLAVILVAVFVRQPMFLREGLMVAAATVSYFTTAKSIHAINEFNFHPVNEVAVLFAGIFATMPPALAWLNAHAAGLSGQMPSLSFYFWATGGLSSLLDNAPTYLGFLSALKGATGVTAVPVLLEQHSGPLMAISFGAVFFGAATYLGNGPNFLVKSVASQQGVPMPSFLEFVVKYTLFYLLPVLIVVWLLFFRS